MYTYSQVPQWIKNLLVNAEEVRDPGSIPGSGRFPGGGLGNPLQYSCLETLHGQRSLEAMARRVAKSLTRLRLLSTHAWLIHIVVPQENK